MRKLPIFGESITRSTLITEWFVNAIKGKRKISLSKIHFILKLFFLLNYSTVILDDVPIIFNREYLNSNLSFSKKFSPNLYSKL